MNRNFVIWVAFCLIIISSGCGQSNIDRSQNTSTTPGNFVFSAASEPAAKQPAPKPRHNQWLAISATGAPSARHQHAAVWTGAEMIVWGGYGPTCANGSEEHCGDGAKYNPATDTWSALSTVNAPTPRANPAAVWTGSLMLIWGGTFSGGFRTDGSRFNPGTDSWSPIAVTSTPASSNGVAVWTGSEMILWDDVQQPLGNQGGRYNPLADSWVATSTVGAPAARVYHTAVWTGSEMIVWGGQNNSTTFNSGGRYDPNADSWQATSLVSAPTQRALHTAVWTGTAMMVWGGDAGLCCWSGTTQFLGTGGIYDPTSDAWEPVATRRAPAARAFHSAVWTGGQMLVWGGATSCSPDPNAPLPAGICSFTNTGGLFDPKSGKWRETTTRSAPEGRFYPSTVWAGDEMLIWGGSHVTSSFFQSGARYRP